MADEGFSAEEIVKDERKLEEVLRKVPPRKLFWKFMENSIIHWRNMYPEGIGHENVKFAEKFLVELANMIFKGDYPSVDVIAKLYNKLL